jgi:hypothetical protein
MAGVEADPDPGLVGHQVQDLAQLAQVPAHRATLPTQGFGSGFNQVSGSGSGFNQVSGSGSESGSGFRSMGGHK